MAMSYYGWSYDQEQAAGWLKPNIEDKNVSPWQMAQYVNEQTELPIRALWRYGGTITMLKSFIAAGFPVIIESGFDVEDLGWMGHYETIVAYDDSSATFWVYDSYLGLGSGSGVTHSYAELDEWWRHFNRVFIVVFPTDREGDAARCARQLRRSALCRRIRARYRPPGSRRRSDGCLGVVQRGYIVGQAGALQRRGDLF